MECSVPEQAVWTAASAALQLDVAASMELGSVESSEGYVVRVLYIEVCRNGGQGGY